MLLRSPDPSVGRLAPEARLLQIKIPLDAAHYYRADLARVAQGQEGFPLGREQFAPPVAPVPGALGVLLGRAASLETSRVTLDALLVVLTHPLLTLRLDPPVVAEALQLVEGRAGGVEAGPELHELISLAF